MTECVYALLFYLALLLCYHIHQASAWQTQWNTLRSRWLYECPRKSPLCWYVTLQTGFFDGSVNKPHHNLSLDCGSIVHWLCYGFLWWVWSEWARYLLSSRVLDCHYFIRDHQWFLTMNIGIWPIYDQYMTNSNNSFFHVYTISVSVKILICEQWKLLLDIWTGGTFPGRWGRDLEWEGKCVASGQESMWTQCLEVIVMLPGSCPRGKPPLPHVTPSDIYSSHPSHCMSLTPWSMVDRSAEPTSHVFVYLTKEGRKGEPLPLYFHCEKT